MDNIYKDAAKFQLLSNDDLMNLDRATMEVLNWTGVEIFDDEARNLLQKAGANVKGNRVRIPTNLIEWALKTIPKKITIYNRKGEPTLFLGYGYSYMSVGQGPPYMIDLYSGKRRKVIKQDIANTTRIIDYLPNIDFIMSLGTASDCAPLMESIYEFESEVLNSTKPIITWAHTASGYSYIIEMASAVKGSFEDLQNTPFIIFYSEPMPPLRHTKEGLQKLLFIAEKNLPQTHATGIIMGASAPVTVPGAIIVANAEQLSALLISQLKREGAPYIYGADILGFDMSTANCSYGAPEMMLANIAIVELAHYYGLPILAHAGTTDSNICDCQAGLEIGYSILLAALCRSDLVHNLGFIEDAMSGSYEALLICDEYLGEVKRMIGGIKINENTLALDEINRIGPGGNFLTSDHTLKNFKMNWFPDLIERRTNNDWITRGKLTLTERANNKAREILDFHNPEPLSNTIVKNIKEILEKANEDLI